MFIFSRRIQPFPRITNTKLNHIHLVTKIMVRGNGCILGLRVNCHLSVTCSTCKTLNKIITGDKKNCEILAHFNIVALLISSILREKFILRHKEYIITDYIRFEIVVRINQVADRLGSN